MKAAERKRRDLCSKLLTDRHRNSAEATEISNETATADPVSLSECENVEMNDVGITYFYFVSNEFTLVPMLFNLISLLFAPCYLVQND